VSEHYFSGHPGRDDRRHDVVVHAWGHRLPMQTVTGVFARAGLDPATDVLLRHSEPPAEGTTVLDLGCGWGPLACAIAAASPGTEVWAIDVNERALELTAANAERLGVDVHAVHPDDVPEDLVFDDIWSNPPIRVGKKALHDILLRWLPRLAEGGHAVLVVGKNLGADSLQRWLVGQGWPTVRTASARGFRVLRVERG
jgi:16S rRNA G1207 methylase RsmC